MRAVVFDRYGPPEVLRLEEVEKPAPKEDEVLIKVHASTVNRTDCGVRAGHPFVTRFFFGLWRPKLRILGTELAGEVESIGSKVREFAVGDQVFGIHAWKFGAHAEFMCIRASEPIAHKPAGVSFEQAAATCDGAVLALKCLRSAGLKDGQRILVHGASGSIVSAAVQLAKYFGAGVTGVCSTKNVDLVKSIGADQVIDRTREDFTKNGQTYDAILDAAGSLSFMHCRASLKRGGFFLATDGFPNVILAAWTSVFGDKKVLLLIPPRELKQDVQFLKQLVEAGKFRPVVDRCYPLDAVVEATKYVETWHKAGNVVLTVNKSNQER